MYLWVFRLYTHIHIYTAYVLGSLHVPPGAMATRLCFGPTLSLKGAGLGREHVGNAEELGDCSLAVERKLCQWLTTLA